MSESRERLNYDDMNAELQSLRKKLEDLKTSQSALGIGARPAARRRFPRRLITASIWLAALLMAAGGLLWGQQSGTLQALFIEPQTGRVGIGGILQPQAMLDVNGDALIRGKLTSKGRLQEDDKPEEAYDIPPRYTLMLTATNYNNKSREIPLTIVDKLCGGPEGCQIVFRLDRWKDGTETQGWGTSFRFFYSPRDYRWSIDRGYGMNYRALGANWGWGTKVALPSLIVDPAGTRRIAIHAYEGCLKDENCKLTDPNQISRDTHIIDLDDACFLSHGWSNPQKGLEMVLWNGNKNDYKERSCTVTLIK